MSRYVDANKLHIPKGFFNKDLGVPDIYSLINAIPSTSLIEPWKVTYTQPYAHFQYTGKLMVSPSGSPWAKKDEKKHYAAPERALNYSKDKNQQAGKEWDKALLEKRPTVLAEVLQKLIERG